MKVRPLTCLGDVGELFDRPPSAFSSAAPPNHAYRPLLRKWWEYEYLAECAELCGCLEGSAQAVGLGVGQEPLIFYFADRCSRVLATDLYSPQAAWSTARFSNAEAVREGAPRRYDPGRLAIASADMRHLPVGDQTADFVWSCSSIEHVLTLKDLVDVLREIGRILKPGGFAFLTSEYCLTEPPYLLPGANALDERILRQLLSAFEIFEPVGPMDLRYNWTHPANGICVRRYLPPGCVPHLEKTVCESCQRGQMAFAVGISAICPIGFVLRRRPGVRFPTWLDLDLDRPIRDYTDAVIDVREGRPDRAIRLLSPYVRDGHRSVSLQFFLLMCRYYLEALALASPTDRNAIDRQIDLLEQQLPSGHVQDADCLDLVAHLLYDHGAYARSAHLFLLAAASPSTMHDHAIRLALGHLKSMSRLGRLDEGIELVSEVLVDLLVSGWNANAIQPIVEEQMRVLQFDRESMTRLNRTFRTRLRSRLSLMPRYTQGWGTRPRLLDRLRGLIRLPQ